LCVRAGAATAIAGLRGGFSDLQLGNFCSFSRMCAPLTSFPPPLHRAPHASTLTVPHVHAFPAPRSFCRKLVASTVMSYIAWLALVPSLYINIADNEEGPW
jgi:hypothetical protein